MKSMVRGVNDIKTTLNQYHRRGAGPVCALNDLAKNRREKSRLLTERRTWKNRIEKIDQCLIEIEKQDQVLHNVVMSDFVSLSNNEHSTGDVQHDKEKMTLCY